MRQWPSRPDGPSSASMAYPRETALAGGQPSRGGGGVEDVASRAAVSTAFQPPFSSAIRHVGDQDVVVRFGITGRGEGGVPGDRPS